MRRRLVFAIAGAVAAAVTVVGVGTLILTQLDARQRSEGELRRRTTELAAVLSELQPQRARPVAQRFEPALDVDAVELVPLADPPGWLTSADVAQLRAGTSVSTRENDTTYAAAPIVRDGAVPRRAVASIDSAGAQFGSAGRWFVLAGFVTVVLGGAVALWLARSFGRPLAAAESATRRIARGDLAARVPEPRGREDELTRLVHAINDMAASLERSRQTEREFLLSVSHDLRTPLTSISGWAEALTDRTAPDTAAAGRTILAESGRLDRLVRDLLDLARLRAKAFTLHAQPVDLRDIASDAIEGLRPELEDSGLAVRLDAAAETVLVNGDADRLAQVAGNLIENAARYATTAIHITVRSDNRDAILAVDDDGPGIPLEDRPRVFERLYTSLRPTARLGSGTGLGLAIVRELARAMGGDVTVSDATSGGARLVVRLPRVEHASDPQDGSRASGRSR